MRGALLALLLLLPVPATPQDAPDAVGALAQAAARRLEEAAALAGAAEGADDRIAALTGTVAAYEEGLALLREAQRGAAAERARIEGELAADREGIERLLGALMSMEAAPGPVTLLHPQGPLGTARAGMLAAGVTPALQARADALRAKLETLRDVEAIQAGAAETLAAGLADAQTARAALAQAAAERRELPRAYTDDPVATALLIASTDTLDAFAQGLAGLAEAPPPGGDARARAGTLPLPVRGRVLRRPGEADAAGVVRPGVVVAAEPGALVTTPLAATLRFRGELLDLGTVAILEPAPGVLWVLAGLGEAWGEPGTVLPEGAAVGLMGGLMGGPVGGSAPSDAILSGEAAAGAAALPQTLYLEVREGGGPVDPAAWFRLD